MHHWLRRLERSALGAGQGAGWALVGFALLLLATGCDSGGGGKSSSGSNSKSPTLSVALTRDGSSTPYKVIVTATLHRANGAAAPGVAVTISGTGATSGGVTDHGDGTYTATLTPTDTSGEIPIAVQATVGGKALQMQRTALNLPTVHAAWGVPEAVRGLVNSAGYEDGPNISPDGQWLVVTDVSPVDAFCCLTGCGSAVSYNSSYCQTVVAPYTAPSRPNFPGAWRIQSPTHILNKCPKVCFTSDLTATGGERTSIAIPPIGGYIFKRQADGSFANPKFVGLDADGCATPTGYSFAGAPSGTSAALVFDFNSPTGPGTSQVYWSPVTLGSTNILANCECIGTYNIAYNNLTAVPLNLTYNQTRSNPSFRGGMLWWDNEDASPYPIHVSIASGAALPGSTFSPNAETHGPVPIGTYTSVDHSQPYFHAATSTLYFRSGDVGISAAVLGGTLNPMSAGDWGSEAVIMAGEGGTRTGAIMAVGQPTIGTPAGGTDEMYFVYAMKTSTGTNFNIGVIPKL